jgi:hypothetical protein
MVCKAATAGESHPSTRVSSILNIRGGRTYGNEGCGAAYPIVMNKRFRALAPNAVAGRLMACSPSGVLAGRGQAAMRVCGLHRGS